MSLDEIKTLDVDALLKYRREIDPVLAEKCEQLETIRAQINDDLRQPSANPAFRPATKPKGKFIPQFQSKQDPNLQWAGRGLTPRWMREEMKGTKLKKEDFRISSAS